MINSVSEGVRRDWVTDAESLWIQAHGPTIVGTACGLLAAWFAGTREGSADNQIWLASSRTGEAWSAPRVVAQGAEAHWNPVLGRGPDGAIWLFYKRGPLISQWRTFVMRSEDEGVSWTASRELVPGDAGGRGPVKNPPLALPGGTWLAPASVEQWGESPVWDAFVDRSEDAGSSWWSVPIPLNRADVTGAGVIQPALWQNEGTGSVYALLRSTEGSAFLSRSDDAGVNWSRARPTALANNNSGLSVAALPSGTVACVHNPVADSWGTRCPLVVSLSNDDGHTWRRTVVIEDGVTPIDDTPGSAPSLPRNAAHFEPTDGGVGTSGVGEFSYPATVVHGDELVVVYTWQRRRIARARIPLKLLT